MRGLIIAAALMCGIGSTFALELTGMNVPVTTGTNTTGSNTPLTLRGYLEQIDITPPANGGTAVVTVVYQPQLTGLAPVVLYTNSALSAGVSLWPRLAITTPATTNVVTRYALVGDLVTVAVNGGPTGKTWNCYIKTER